MKRRLKEMEEEAAALREMQAKVEKEMGSVQGFLFLFSWLNVLIFSLLYDFFFNFFFLVIRLSKNHLIDVLWFFSRGFL